LGVPEEHLGGHAYHWITFMGYGVSITINTKINGHRTYAIGALAIADLLASLPTPLEPRVYGIVEILRLMPA
jgi:dihydrodipicolinate reductase